VIDEKGEGEGDRRRSLERSEPSSETVKSTTATTDGRRGFSSNPGAILSMLRVSFLSLHATSELYLSETYTFFLPLHVHGVCLFTLPEIGAIEDVKYTPPVTPPG